MPTGQQLNVAWATGIFEGEGCIAWSKQKGQPRLSVRMTDRDAVLRVYDTFGVGHLTGPYTSSTKNPDKPLWRWRTSTIRDTYPVLELMWPYLGERRKARAKEVIQQYYDNPRKRVVTYPYYPRREL